MVINSRSPSRGPPPLIRRPTWLLTRRLRRYAGVGHWIIGSVWLCQLNDRTLGSRQLLCPVVQDLYIRCVYFRLPHFRLSWTQPSHVDDAASSHVTFPPPSRLECESFCRLPRMNSEFFPA